MISVVIPLYNKEKSINGTICSVLSQIYYDFEIVIVNDGSTDNSLAIVHDINDKRIRIIEQENLGVSAARNRGVKEARGEWIVLLDADDILLPYALHILYNLVERYGTKIATANLYSLTKDGYLYKYINSSFNGVIKNNYRSWFFEHFFIRMGNSIISKEVLLQYPFNLALRRYEDYEAFFRMMKCNKIAVSQQPIMLYSFLYGELACLHDDLSKDYTGNLPFHEYSFWGKLNLALLYAQGLQNYNQEVLNELYHRYNIYLHLSKTLNIWLRFKRKLHRFKNKFRY